MMARSLRSTMLSQSTRRARLFVTFPIPSDESTVDHVLEAPGPPRVAMNALPPHEGPPAAGVEQRQRRTLRPEATGPAAAQRRAQTAIERWRLAHGVILTALVARHA